MLLFWKWFKFVPGNLLTWSHFLSFKWQLKLVTEALSSSSPVAPPAALVPPRFSVFGERLDHKWDYFWFFANLTCDGLIWRHFWFLCLEGFNFLPQEPPGCLDTWCFVLLVWHFALWPSCRFVLLPWILEYICALTSFASRLFVALRFPPSFHPFTRTLTCRPGATQKTGREQQFVFAWPLTAERRTFFQENQRIFITSTEGSFFCSHVHH